MKKKVAELWGLFQSEALEFRGLKYVDSKLALPTIFTEKKFAEDHLVKLVKWIKSEIKVGRRTKDNLNRRKKLDFLIAPVWVYTDAKFIRQRGWRFPDKRKSSCKKYQAENKQLVEKLRKQ